MQRDPAAVRRVLHGVVQQIHKNLFELAGVTEGGQIARRTARLDGHRPDFGQGHDRADGSVDDRGDPYRTDRNIDGSALETTDFEQIIDQTAQAIDRIADRSEIRFLFRWSVCTDLS